MNYTIYLDENGTYHWLHTERSTWKHTNGGK